MSKSQELKTTTELVKQILETVPQTRNDDNLLYYRVCDAIDSDVLGFSFGWVLMSMKELNIPSIETVGRCRRKLQNQYPELRANETVEGFRELNEQTFREYAKEIV